MNNLPVTVQAVADTSRAAKSLENLTRKREVILAATLDAKSIASANKPLGAIKRSADEFEKSMAAANARVLAFGTSVAVIEGMRRSFLALIKTTAEVEKSLTQIKVVANDELRAAGISIEKVGSQIFDLAKKTGQSFDATSKSFLEFARQGLKPAQTLERTRTALELVRISGAEQEKVIGGLTAAYNAFSSSGLSFTKIAEKLVNVDNKTTTSVEGLVDVLSRASSTAKLTGTSFEELLAVTATLKDITARSESVIGNAYRSISARLIDPKVLQNLEELGIKTREFDGGPLLKTIGILTNVGEKLKEIADPSLQTEIVKSISGLYQFDQLTALISALQDVNNLQGFYQKNLKASKEDSDALNKANEAFSATLINKFNAVDVTIQQVLNSLGKIGIKNPLAGLLDSLVEVGEGFTNFIDGDSFGSDIARGFVKGFGGVLLGPTGVVTVGFIIAKIIKDFGVFAFDAAKSFLSLNKTAKDQELIQKSILTTISQMPSILNGIENTESGRLLLAQRVSAEYERQLSLAATLNNIAKGAAQSVYGQGFRITDKGLTKGKRASSGYLPDLISSEMRDVKSGVGGANPNSKIVVMPNFPFGGGKRGLMVANSSEIAMKMGDSYGILNPDMMGQRSASGFLAGQKLKTSGGKFASVNNIQEGLKNLVQLLVGMDKSLPEIREASKNFAKSFQLNEKSLDLVVDASARYASSVREASDRIARETSKEAIRKAVGKADQTIRSAPEKRGAFTPPIIVPSSGAFINRPSLREIENALKESSLKMIVEAADAVNQKIFDGILEKRKQIAEYIKKNPPNPLALGLSRTSLPGRDLSGNPTFAYLNQPIRHSGPTSSDPLTRATEIGRQREIDRLATQQRGLSVAPTLVEAARIRQNYQYNPTAAFGGSQRLSAQNLPSSVALPAEIVKKAQGSLESFAIKTFAASAIVDIVGAQFRGMNETTDKLIDAFSKATLAVAGFAFLNKGSGLTASKVFEGAGGLLGGIGKKAGGGIIGRAIGATSSGVSSAIGAVSTFGRGLLSVVPVLGQIGLAGFVINEFSKVFSDKSFFDRIYESFGGLSDAGEKAKNAFEDFSKSVYVGGKFSGVSREERSAFLSSQREQARLKLEAKASGIETGGKTTEEIGSEIVRKDILSALLSVKTGGTVDRSLTETPNFDQENLLDQISGDARENVILAMSALVNGTAEDLKLELEKRGIKDVDPNDFKRARQAIVKSFFEGIIKSVPGQTVDFRNLYGGDTGAAKLFSDVFRELPAKNVSARSESASGFISSSGGLISEGFFGKGQTLSPEIQQFYLERAKDISLIMLEDAANSLESRIKSLDLESRDEGLTAAARNAKERQKAELEKQVLDIGQSRRAVEISTQRELTRIGDLPNDQKLIEISKLDAELKNLTNSTTREKKAVDDNVNSITKATSALDRFNAALSGIDTALSFVGLDEARSESRISLLQARANNPSLSIGAQESLQRQINQETINRLQTSGIQSAGLRYSRSITEAGRLPEGSQERIDAEKQAAAALAAEAEAINGQISAIKESTAQIGNVKSSFVSLNDAIEQFTRNLGESRGQNQFNLLQATDANSIVQGLIGERVYDSAGGKSGAELVSFIADQNALLNEQFKIRTASSETERLELERQLELTTQLLDIKNSNLSSSEKQAQTEAAINNNLEKRRTFSSGIQDATATMRDRVNNFGNEFGKTTANAFRDGLSDAIKAAVSQTDNLKDALLDVALAFANKLRDAAIDNLVDSLMSGSKGGGGSSIIGGILNFVGGLFGGARGYAKGGQVTGGSGTKDDVPTFLMGGEYVIPKDVVNSYGKTFFDRIRDGSVGKMAAGGYFAPGVRGQGSIVGKENLLDFAAQTATSGSQDVRQTLRGGAGLVSLEPESLRLSNFARFGDSPIVQATQDAKEQAFGLYLDQLGQEKQYQEELSAYYRELEEASAAQKKAKKDKQKQLLLSLASAVIGGAISSGFGGGKSSRAGETRYNGGRIRNVSERPFSPAKSGYSFSSSYKGSSSGGFSMDNIAPLQNYVPQFDYREMVRQITANIANGSSSFFKQYDLGINRGGSSYLLPSVSYTPYRNSGGYGSGNGDTRQTMISNKEHVLSGPASEKLGDKALYSLNRGIIPNQQSDDSAILAKLDELIQKTSGQNSVSVTVNAGKENDQTSSEGDSDSNQRNRLLAEKIKSTVLQIMRDEKRPGGLLTK